MKYIMVIPDGLTDKFLINNRKPTPLDKAKIPNIDYMLQNGITGTVNTIPKNINPGSDVANLSLLGVNPKKAMMGRAALESLSQNISLKKNETVFRMNFIKIADNKMKDYSGGEISTEDAKQLVEILNKNFDNNVRFYHGVSYRNLAVFNKRKFKIKTTPAHDILDKKIKAYLPEGEDSVLIKDVMGKAHEILKNSEYIKKRKLQVSDIWLWGEGCLKKVPSFFSRTNIKGAVISAVDIVRGIAKLLKMDVISVPGITGTFNTNYKNKCEYALNNIDKYDFIYIHIESPDEAGHKGDFKEKQKAIEKIDKEIIKPLLKNKKQFNIIVLPDHPTPIALKTHINQEVPFILFSKYKDLKKNHEYKHYSEQILRNSPLKIKDGYKFIGKFIKLFE